MGGVETSEATAEAAREGETVTTSGTAQGAAAAAGRGKESRATGHAGTAAGARGTIQGGEIRKGIATGTTAAMAGHRSEMGTAEVAAGGRMTTDVHTGAVRGTAMIGETTDGAGRLVRLIAALAHHPKCYADLLSPSFLCGQAGKSGPAHPQASQLEEVSRLCRWTRQHQARAKPGSSCLRRERAFSRIGPLLERRPSESASCRSSRSLRMTGWEVKVRAV